MGKHYLPNLAQREEMLKEIGFSSVDELFADVPKGMVKEFNLPKGKSEYEVFLELNEVLSRNRTVLEMPSFLGAGTYFHYVPAHVKYLIERSEFLTAYTPYQPEISQGMLQALFEYQSMMAELYGLPVVNSSMYDWGTAIAEAALMTVRLHRGKRKRFVIPKALSPEKRTVIKTYTRGADLEIVEVPWDEEGKLDLEKLKDAVKDSTGVYVEMANFFGLVEENVREIGEIVHDAGTYFVVGADPTMLGIFEAPGELGADIAVGEASYLGSPPNFGGPRAGVFAVKDDKKLIRQMPGRIIGMTKDADGRRAFVMTLQTREQHIRRAKATSNICSNEALVAVASAIHLASLGPKGLAELGEAILKNTTYLKKRLSEVAEVPFEGLYFKDVPARFEKPYRDVHEALLAKGIHGGHYIGKYFPELGETALFAATETTRKEWVDALIKALKEMT